MNYEITEQIKAANKEIKPDLVIKNGKIVNVFTLEIEEEDLAIHNGFIVGIGSYEGKKTVDAKGKFIVPGLIDGHVHIESSMVPPSHFAHVVVPHGVTTVVTDPHEIANVAGVEGIQFMLDDSEGSILDTLFMLPSCVPATPFENSGAELSAEDLAPFYEHPRVIGLAEVMDYPSVSNAEPGMIQKLTDARTRHRVIDGHGAGLDAHSMNVYGSAGITTDHESTQMEEAKERLRKGLYVIIREGSGAKDLRSLIPLVNAGNARRFLFCTDDKHLDELKENGSIDDNVRLAVSQGLDPILAIQMATLNASECYGLKTKGAVAPGYQADLLFIKNLEEFQVEEVYKNGKLVAKEGEMLSEAALIKAPPSALMSSVNLTCFTKEMLSMKMEKGGKAYAIKLKPNSLVTEKITVEPAVIKDEFQPEGDADLLKMAVIERHHNTGNVGLGMIQGLGFTKGAIALTVAHDSHNLVTAGLNDEDMLVAIQEIERINGGIVLVKDGDVLASITLNIAGLMSSETGEKTYSELKKLDKSLSELGFNGDFNPFSALSFMCLPVIPALKLTDLGYFDAVKGTHIAFKVNEEIE
ncbi:adenine deaminase [Salipaludibacillus neizhouensis]|uniref:Adenine deaminase n=1 Tax=Salipaludibacillus neizhouensis TaxID=885475 RepID=A0A3A9K970_9BACI|nr:adenine deaminase [Salipaludibacillus neizhouensis]RKL66193.1 adenine deaminase [Salipaludibacillus neizhouensis]